MSVTEGEMSIDGMPAGLAARVPTAADGPAVEGLLTAQQRAAKGSAGVDPTAVLTQLAGIGSWTRRQALVHDGVGRLLAWLSVHDRASGRTLVEVTVAPDLPAGNASELALALFAAADRHAVDIATTRRLPATLLDSGAYEGDTRQQGWLTAAGFAHARTWLQMTRPVERGEATSFPAAREGVVVRPVEQHDDGLPVARDLQTVHRLLEESFADHFSSYRESFPEFVMRLREDPGHRWDLCRLHRRPPWRAWPWGRQGAAAHRDRGRGTSRPEPRRLGGGRRLTDRRRRAVHRHGLGHGLPHPVMAPRRPGALARASLAGDVDHQAGRARQHEGAEGALALAHADEGLPVALEAAVDRFRLRDDGPRERSGLGVGRPGGAGIRDTDRGDHNLEVRITAHVYDVTAAVGRRLVDVPDPERRATRARELPHHPVEGAVPADPDHANPAQVASHVRKGGTGDVVGREPH